MRPTRVAISTDAGPRYLLTYLFPYDVDNQVNPEDFVDIEHELDRLECLLADNSQAHVPSPSPPHGIFPSFQSLHKMHLSLSSFEHDTKFSVCVCIVLQAVASVEANRAVVVRGAHAVTVSTATCHPLHRCVLAARPIKSAIAATVTYPPTAIPIILTAATHAQRNYRRLITAPLYGTSSTKQAYQLREAPTLSAHSSPPTRTSSLPWWTTTNISTGTFAKNQ